ncbi:MAG: hypothetical protein ABW123_04355 [Cystobacter sp.]
MRSGMAALLTAVALTGCGGAEGDVEQPSHLDAAPGPLTAELRAGPSASLSAGAWYMIWRWPGAPRHDPPVGVSVSGGTAPYSYSWQRLSGDPSAYAISPNSASTQFNNYIPVGDQNPYTSIWRCVVTDSAGAVTTTPNLFVSLEVTGYRPGGDPEP